MKIFIEIFHNLLNRVEKWLFKHLYFSLHKRLSYWSRLKLLWKFLLYRIAPTYSNQENEIIFVLYSKAGGRMLIPLLVELLLRKKLGQTEINIRLILIEQIYQLELSPSIIKQLRSLGCKIEPDHFCLIKACRQPKGKLVVLCLDQRKVYQYHRYGVDAADRLRRLSVKTVSIQHGGTADNFMKELASSASDVILVWGKRTYRELTDHYGVSPERVKVVGNPLHDRLIHLDSKQVLKTLFTRYPKLEAQYKNKRIALLATRLHSDYRNFPNEEQMYMEYMKHLYFSLDVSKIFLIVKMHPHDTLSPNLYLQSVPSNKVRDSLLIVEPDDIDLDVYSLMSVSDFIITRASTVGEEALLFGKKVIAFDLIPSGPVKFHKHLAQYGDYSIVYATPKHELRAKLSNSANCPRTNIRSLSAATEHDLTYRLDGRSASRAVDEILSQVDNSIRQS